MQKNDLFFTIKLVNVTVTDHDAFAAFWIELQESCRLQTLTVSQVHVASTHLDEMIKFFADNPSSLQHLDISWLDRRRNITELLEAVSRMNHLKSLSLAHIHVPEAATPHLVKILKRNPLKHLDLSGCLTTAKQVATVIKKIAKHRSLLIAHLSDTPVLETDERLREYM